MGLTHRQPGCYDIPMQRILIIADPELIDGIDRSWHRNRLRNRSAAIRHLLELGLDAEMEAASGQKSGVVMDVSDAKRPLVRKP